MGKLTISMVIFNSYFDKLPEGNQSTIHHHPPVFSHLEASVVDQHPKSGFSVAQEVVYIFLYKGWKTKRWDEKN